MGWFGDRWHNLTGAGFGAWLALAAWAAVVVGVIALVYLARQLRHNRRLTAARTGPHVGMLMEPHPADWHVIELVVRNFGQTPAYDVSFAFQDPPSVARYEMASDGYADVVPLQLPRELPVLAPGQEWRTVWDSAIDRAELGDAIASRFTGSVCYYDSPESSKRLPWRSGRPQHRTKVVLDWNDLPPVQRLELLTTHDLAKQEKQKLELLRSLLTYFHYACQETLPEAFRSDVERINGAAREVQDRLRSRILPVNDNDEDDATVRLSNGAAAAGKHHG